MEKSIYQLNKKFIIFVSLVFSKTYKTDNQNYRLAMKKRTILTSGVLIAAAMLIPMLSNAQKTVNYKVVKVQGQIQRLKTGNMLSVGENVVSNENFDFKTSYSRAVVINKDRGCMILSAQAGSSGAQFLPSSSNMSVRAAQPAYPSDVLNYYYGDILITGFDSLKVNEKSLKLDDKNYFTATYSIDGKEQTEILILSNGKLVLPKTIVENHPEKVVISYNDEFGVNSKSEFTPVYADKEVLKGEVDMIFNTMKGKRAEKVKAVTNMVNNFYGKADEPAVDAWIKNNTKHH